VIAEEDSPRRTHHRLRALLRGHGFDPDDPSLRANLDTWLRIAPWTGFTFDAQDMVDRLKASIAEFQPEICYVDVLRKVTLRDLNKAAEAGELLAILDGLRREHGVVFRIVHHYRKAQGHRVGRGSQEIGGSFVLGAWAENSLFFEPVGRKQGPARVEVQTKDAPPIPGFRLKIESEGPAYAPTLVRLVAEEDVAPNSLDDVVWQAIGTLPKEDAVEGEPGVSLKAVVAHLKKGDKTIRRCLERLCKSKRCLVTGTATKGAKLYGVSDQ